MNDRWVTPAIHVLAISGLLLLVLQLVGAVAAIFLPV